MSVPSVVWYRGKVLESTLSGSNNISIESMHVNWGGAPAPGAPIGFLVYGNVRSIKYTGTVCSLYQGPFTLKLLEI